MQLCMYKYDNKQIFFKSYIEFVEIIYITGFSPDIKHFILTIKYIIKLIWQ